MLISSKWINIVIVIDTLDLLTVAKKDVSVFAVPLVVFINTHT